MSARDEIITGGRELQEVLDTLPGKMQKNINRAGLRAGAVVLLAKVRENIPVDQGNLLRTARISGRAKGAEVAVSVKVGGKHKGVDAFYARFVEYGTRPHLIKVQDSERGVNRRTGRLVSMTTINRQQRALQIGGNFVGPVVSHPGSRKKAFMRPAVDEKLPEALRAITNKIRERLNKQGLNTPAPLPADPIE